MTATDGDMLHSSPVVVMASGPGEGVCWLRGSWNDTSGIAGYDQVGQALQTVGLARHPVRRASQAIFKGTDLPAVESAFGGRSLFEVISVRNSAGCRK
ncbi:hypothetical protein G7046_g7264 [Stylonectria norvegica]|nr:hypothetical protein G7046_g7264 [Stylonectria norvegica]